MNKVNVEKLTAELNKFRMENQNKTFTSQEIYEALERMGFNKSVSKRMTRLFEFERLGTAKLFSMPKTPIHKGQVESVYKQLTENRINNYKKAAGVNNPEIAMKMLKAQGYKIQKCVGFDVERFAKENPVLYQKYLKYETV